MRPRPSCRASPLRSTFASTGSSSMRSAYTEKLHIGPQDRHLAIALLNGSAQFHDGTLVVLYHDTESCFSITSPRGGYRAVQRAKRGMWDYVLQRMRQY